MKIFGHKCSSVLTALALFAGVLFLPAPVLAQVPTNGVFYGCLQDEGKFVRLVGANEACKKNETRVSWNQQGVKGDAGPKGDAGTSPAVASIGANGACGSVAGVQITDGTGHSEYVCNGVKGDKGDTGEKGKDGSDATVVVEGSNSGFVPINIAAGDSANNNGNTVVTKLATGFRGYVAWGAVAVRITNPGPIPAATAVGCVIKQTTPSLNSGAPMPLDGRGFTTVLPTAVNASVVYNIALVGDSPKPADDGSEVTSFSIVCGYNGNFATPPTNVTVLSSSLVVMGIGNTFQIPNN